MATRSANRIKKTKLPPLPTDAISASTTISKLRKVTSEEDALEEIKTEEFYNTLKSYYTHRDGESEITTRGNNVFAEMSHADLLEYFYNDRSWRNNNTGSMTKDLAILIGPSSKYLTTNGFLDELDGQLKKKLN